MVNKNKSNRKILHKHTYFINCVEKWPVSIIRLWNVAKQATIEVKTLETIVLDMTKVETNKEAEE